MTTALTPYPKPLRVVNENYRLDYEPDPWEGDPQVREDKAPYTVESQPTPFVRLDVALNKAIARAHLTGVEGDTLRIIMAECWEIVPTPHYGTRQLAGGYLAAETGHDLDSTRRALTMLKARGIVRVVRKNCPQLGNAGDIITLNTDPDTWLSAGDVRWAKEAKKTETPHASNLPYSAKMTNTDSAKTTHAGSSNLTKNLRSQEDSREINTKNTHRAHESDVSPVQQTEPTQRKPPMPAPKPIYRLTPLEMACARWQERNKAAYPAGDGLMPMAIRKVFTPFSEERPTTEAMLVALVDLAWDAHALPENAPARLRGEPAKWGNWLQARIDAFYGIGTPLTLAAYQAGVLPRQTARAAPVSLMTKFGGNHATREDMIDPNIDLRAKFRTFTYSTEAQP